MMENSDELKTLDTTSPNVDASLEFVDSDLEHILLKREIEMTFHPVNDTQGSLPSRLISTDLPLAFSTSENAALQQHPDYLVLLMMSIHPTYKNKINLKSISFCTSHGFPRCQMLHFLLWQIPRIFFSSHPSLMITNQQIKLAVYHDALSKYLVKGDYLLQAKYLYHLHRGHGTREILFRMNCSEFHLIGLELYGLGRNR